MLNVRKLDAFYGKKQILFGVDLALPDGEYLHQLLVKGPGELLLLTNRGAHAIRYSPEGLEVKELTKLERPRAMATRAGRTLVATDLELFELKPEGVRLSLTLPNRA